MSADAKDTFFAEHGDYVLCDGFYLFADAATVEDTPYGRLAPPPADDWERAKLIYRYWQVVAQTTEQQFLDYKLYLGGTGKRESQWATLYTEDQQLAHLRQLRQAAMRVRARLSKAKRAMKDACPAWLTEREAAEVEDLARKRQFLDSVESIEL